MGADRARVRLPRPVAGRGATGGGGGTGASISSASSVGTGTEVTGQMAPASGSVTSSKQPGCSAALRAKRIPDGSRGAKAALRSGAAQACRSKSASTRGNGSGVKQDLRLR